MITESFIGFSLRERPTKRRKLAWCASTDESRNIIDSFRGKVAAYFMPKSYQRGAHIFGFGQSTGDVIIFLDDLPQPDVMLEVATCAAGGLESSISDEPDRRHRYPVGVRTAATSGEGQS